MSDTLHTLHVGLPHVLASYAGERARTQTDTLSNVIGARIDALAVEKEPRFYFEKAAFDEVSTALLSQSSTWLYRTIKLTDSQQTKLASFLQRYDIPMYCSAAYLLAAHKYRTGSVSLSLSEIQTIKYQQKRDKCIRLDIGQALTRRLRQIAGEFAFDFPRLVSIALLYYRKIDTAGDTFIRLTSAEKTAQQNRCIAIPSFLFQKPAFYDGSLRSYVGDAVFSYTRQLQGI